MPKLANHLKELAPLVDRLVNLESNTPIGWVLIAFPAPISDPNNPQDGFTFDADVVASPYDANPAEIVDQVAKQLREAAHPGVYFTEGKPN